MKKEHFIFIPLALILIIQLLDKKGDYIIAQYILLGIMIVALIIKLARRKEDKSS